MDKLEILQLVSGPLNILTGLMVPITHIKRRVDVALVGAVLALCSG